MPGKYRVTLPQNDGFHFADAIGQTQDGIDERGGIGRGFARVHVHGRIHTGMNFFECADLDFGRRAQ